QHVLVGEAPQPPADLGLRNGRDLVDHGAPCALQAIGFSRLNGQAQKRGGGTVRGQSANGDGIRRIEAILLKDHHWALARRTIAERDGPDLASLHLFPHTDTESMKSWSVFA